MRIFYEYGELDDKPKSLVMWRRSELDLVFSSIGKIAQAIERYVIDDRVKSRDNFMIEDLGRDTFKLLLSKLVKQYNTLIDYMRLISANRVEWVDMTKFDTRFEVVLPTESTNKSLLDGDYVQGVSDVVREFSIIMDWLNSVCASINYQPIASAEVMKQLLNSTGFHYSKSDLSLAEFNKVVAAILQDKYNTGDPDYE